VGLSRHFFDWNGIAMQRSDLDAQVSPPAAAPTSGWYKWAVVGMLWFVCFFNYADRQAINAVLPLLGKEFQFDKEQQGYIASAFMWVYAISAPLAGGVGDRTSRKMLILGGLYVWSIVTGFTAACTRLWHFVFVRGAEGFGETFYFPASMSLVSDYHSKRTRSRAMSLHQTSVYAGTVGGAWFAGWMAVRTGDWRYPFAILGAAGVLLGIVLAFFIREPQRNEAERRESGELDTVHPTIKSGVNSDRGFLAGALATFLDVIKFGLELLLNPAALLLVLAFCGANFVAFVFITWMPTFLYETYKLNLASAAFNANFFMQVASMVGAIVGGLLADRVSQRFSGGRSLVQALGLILGAPFIYWVGGNPELNIVLAAMTCFGFGKGIYDSNIWASLYDVVPAESRGKAVGFTNMIGWMAAGVGAAVPGALVERGYEMSTILSSMVVVYVGIAGLLIVASLLAAKQGGRAPAV
jgi:MFS family permease